LNLLLRDETSSAFFENDRDVTAILEFLLSKFAISKFCIHPHFIV